MNVTKLAIVFVGALAIGLVMCSAGSAGVINTLAGFNADNDSIADDSLGFITDVSGDGGVPGVDDVAWGIVRIDNINLTPFTGIAYMVYSAQIESVGGGVITHKTTTATAYRLGDLLGNSALNSSMVAVIEWSGFDTNPFTNASDYPFQNGFMNRTEGQFKSDLTTLMTNSTVLFALGLSDTDDNLVLTGTGSGTLFNVSGAFSVTYVSTGLNASDFKPLIGDPTQQAAIVTGATQVLQNATYSGPGASIKTRDQGNYQVNYVPEPTSLAGLLGAGLTGLALLRRRRKA